MVLVDHLLQSLAKIPHQGAADAAGVHLPDFNARLLEEAAVNADFTELILNEDQLLLAVTLSNHFADQSRLAGSQETRVYINLCQEETPSILYFDYIIAHFCENGKGYIRTIQGSRIPFFWVQDTHPSLAQERQNKCGFIGIFPYLHRKRPPVEPDRTRKIAMSKPPFRHSNFAHLACIQPAQKPVSCGRRQKLQQEYREAVKATDGI